MQLTSRRIRTAAQVALGLGVVMVVVTVLWTWRAASSDDASSSSDQADPSGVHSSSGLDALTPEPRVMKTSGDDARGLPGAGSGVQLGPSSGSGPVHQVKIEFTSDNSMYVGWLYRSKVDGSKVAGRAYTVRAKVRGVLPVAQAGVQVLAPGTSATCTIYVDGRKVSTETAKGVNKVAVCTG